MKYDSAMMGLALAMPALVQAGEPSLVELCADRCIDAFKACRNTPNVNMAQCDSDYTRCLGFSPFSGTVMATPTACSPSRISTSSASSNATSTQAASKACENKFNACRSKPGANISTCSSEKAACLAADRQSTSSATYPTPTSKKDNGVKACEDKFNGCRGKPGANISTCASERAACLAECAKKPAPTSSTKYSSSTTPTSTTAYAGTTTYASTTTTTSASQSPTIVYVAGGVSVEPSFAYWTMGLGALMLLL